MRLLQHVPGARFRVPTTTTPVMSPTRARSRGGRLLSHSLSSAHHPEGRPIRSFNRHALAHGASPVQFTELIALLGLLLVTALSRGPLDVRRRSAARRVASTCAGCP